MLILLLYTAIFYEYYHKNFPSITTTPHISNSKVITVARYTNCMLNEVANSPSYQNYLLSEEKVNKLVIIVSYLVGKSFKVHSVSKFDILFGLFSDY